MSINPPDTLLTAWVGVLRPFAEAGLAVAADQTLLALNPAAEQFFGCPLAEAYRQPVQRLLPDWAGPEAVGLTGCRWDGTLFPVTARRLSAADAAGVTILFLEAGVPADETFLRVFEASPLPMALTDLSTHRYAEVNEALLQSLGYDRSDVIGRTPASLGLFAIPEQRDQALRTIQTDGRLRNFEVAIRTKAGEVRSGLFSAEYFQAQGRKYLLTVMEDITDRQRAEAERRAAEAKFRSYIEHAPLAIFVADERGRFVDFNPAALALLGYSAAQLSQMSIPDLIAPPDLEAGRRHFQTVVAEGVADGELRFCHQAGRTVWASVHAVRLGPDRFMAFCQDVSQRRLTEMALRESEAQYRLLADNTADVIWVIDLATMRFTYMSPSAERLRGYGVEETLAQTLAEVLTPASLAAVEARLPARAAAFLAGDPAAIRESMELEQVRRDGSTVCTEVATTLVRKPDGGLEVVGTTRDISDRKRMELELRHSEERYRLITAVVSDYAFSTRVGPAGELTHDWVAGAFEGITGYTFAEYVAAGGWQALVHPADRVVDTRDQNVILNNQPVRSQVRVLTKSGAERWVQIYAHPVWSDSEQRVVGIHGAVQDITERRRAQEALRESEARYRSLFETMADGVVYQDAAGRIVHANPAAEHLLGLSLAQMRGRTSTDPSWQALHEDGTPFSGEAHPAMVALRTGRPVSNVVMGVIHPGEARHRWIVVNAIPQFQPGAAAAFQVFTTFTDITKRKEIEAALRESEERYRVLFEGTGEGIVIVDPAGQQFQYANPAMCALFGYTLAELQSLSVLGLHPDEAAARVQAEFSAIAAGRRTRASAIPCRRRDGTHFYADIAGYPMRVAGRDVLVGFFTDVTERRRAEALLQARLRLSDRAAQAPLDELLRLTLDEAEVVTDSQIGYFHFVEPDQVTLSLQTWSTRTLAELCTAEGHSRHYPVDQAGVWA
ncbi:MAG: PAS domain S-box protein, partial [Anaerolineales bacterium]|nr:PAS domain S-box protein [Anaerolineales bacterium]